MLEQEIRTSVLVAVESQTDSVLLECWAAACGKRVVVVAKARQVPRAVRDSPAIHLILCSPGKMERRARYASRRAAHKGRFIAVFAVDGLDGRQGSVDGWQRAVTEALRVAWPPHAGAGVERHLDVGQLLQCGPVRIHSGIDRVWIDGKRNDAIRGELYLLLKALVESASGTIRWHEVDRSAAIMAEFTRAM